MTICMRKNCSNKLSGKQDKYCSSKCKKIYLQSREHQRYKSEPNGLTCDQCDNQLIGRQKLFCSNKCKCLYNYEHNKIRYNKSSYQSQSDRGYTRKLEMVSRKGGSCEICGYSNNLAALVFHHLIESEKSFNLDIRNISNRSIASIHDEVSKCQLLCHNCHHELHHPHMEIKKIPISEDL